MLDRLVDREVTMCVHVSVREEEEDSVSLRRMSASAGPDYQGLRQVLTGSPGFHHCHRLTYPHTLTQKHTPTRD